MFFMSKLPGDFLLCLIKHNCCHMATSISMEYREEYQMKENGIMGFLWQVYINHETFSRVSKKDYHSWDQGILVSYLNTTKIQLGKTWQVTEKHFFLLFWNWLIWLRPKPGNKDKKYSTYYNRHPPAVGASHCPLGLTDMCQFWEQSLMAPTCLITHNRWNL